MAKLFYYTITQQEQTISLHNVKEFTVRLRGPLKMTNPTIINGTRVDGYVIEEMTPTNQGYYFNAFAYVNNIPLYKYLNGCLTGQHPDEYVAAYKQQSSDTLHFTANDKDLINQELQCTLTQEAIIAGYYLEIFGVQGERWLI